MLSQWGRMGKISVQTASKLFLKTLTEGAVTTEAGSLFQYFTLLTENADPLLRRRLAPWSNLKRCPLRPRREGGRKNKFNQYPKGQLEVVAAAVSLRRGGDACQLPMRR